MVLTTQNRSMRNAVSLMNRLNMADRVGSGFAGATGAFPETAYLSLGPIPLPRLPHQERQAKLPLSERVKRRHPSTGTPAGPVGRHPGSTVRCPGVAYLCVDDERNLITRTPDTTPTTLSSSWQRTAKSTVTAIA